MLVAQMPAKLISINEVAGKHWGAVHGLKERWRDAGYWHGADLRGRLIKGRVVHLLDPVEVQFDFDVLSNARRDGHNYAGTVCKWFIDGMVKSGLLFDDSSDHLTLKDSTFSRTDRITPQMRVTLETPNEP